MNRRKIINGIIKIVTFFLLFFLCFQVVYNVTKRKKAYRDKNDFFNQEENFDVLFFGSSYMGDSVNPMELWNNYGIISYNMWNSAERVAATYYNILLALKQTSPKLIVVDVSQIYTEEKIDYKLKEHMHNTFDPYPISYTKYRAIKDLYSEYDTREMLFEFLFNFSIYHARWDELSKGDFYNEKSYTKGSQILANINIPKELFDYDLIDVYSKEENVNMQYLRKIIEYCKENQIEILLTFMPQIDRKIKVEVSKYAQIISEEYNVNYINFMNMDIVNYNIDIADNYSHLNFSGSMKITDYIGKYIIENYDIKDQRNNKAYKFWYEDYNEYIDYKISNLKKNQNNLNNYLLLLYGESDIKYEIKVSSKKEIEKGSTLYNLLANIDNNYTIDDNVFLEKTDKSIQITTWDKRDGKLISRLYW